MRFNDQPQYNSPNLLIGPLPYIFYNGCYAPDYSYQGVAERIKVEVDMIEDEAYDKRKL